MRTYLYIVILSVLLIPCVSRSQNWRERLRDDVEVATLRVIDAAGKRTELYFGVHADASYGYDYDLGELPVPPVPAPGAFEARFIDTPRHPRTPPGGCYIDIRGFAKPGVADTFAVQAQPLNGAYPITLAWEREELQTLFQSITLEYGAGDTRHGINMLESPYAMIEEEEMVRIYIIAIHADDTKRLEKNSGGEQ